MTVRLRTFSLRDGSQRRRHICLTLSIPVLVDNASMLVDGSLALPPEEIISKEAAAAFRWCSERSSITKWTQAQNRNRFH